MVSKIWGYFIVIGIVYSIFFGDVISLNETILNSTKTSLELILQIEVYQQRFLFYVSVKILISTK